MTTAIGLLILLSSIIGNTVYWVMWVNRSHSLRIDYRLLKATRKVHDVAVLSFPVWLVWKIGLAENGLLQGGTLQQQPDWAKWVVVATFPGLVVWILSVLRWQLRHKYAFAAADRRQVFNLLSSNTQPPATGNIKGNRWRPSLLFPFNDVFRLEVNQKSICVRSSQNSEATADQPADTKRCIRIVHFSDLHFVNCPGEGYYRWLFETAARHRPDAFAFTGDLIDDPSLLPLAQDLMAQLPAIAPCFFVLGNHDWRYDYASIRATIIDAGWTDVAGKAITTQIGGCQVLVAGNELPWLGTAPPSVLNCNADLRLLLSHSPDQVKFARREKYDVMLAGHTHGGQVVLPFSGPVYAPSIHGVRYASGLFKVEDLHLHVSRGVGGKDPLRWRCPPELTCLEIALS